MPYQAGKSKNTLRIHELDTGSVGVCPRWNVLQSFHPRRLANLTTDRRRYAADFGLERGVQVNGALPQRPSESQPGLCGAGYHSCCSLIAQRETCRLRMFTLAGSLASRCPASRTRQLLSSKLR
jgi:hypothetical protein